MDESPGKEPFVPVCFFLSYFHEMSDYREARNLLKKALNLDPRSDGIVGLVTDDEGALHGGLKENQLYSMRQFVHTFFASST